MERTAKKTLPSHVEFAGTTLPNGSIRVERTGADSQRDWAITLGSQQWHEIDVNNHTLAKMILVDVFGKETARCWHDVFTRDVVQKFGRRSFRITAAEVSEWHFGLCENRDRCA